MHCIYIGNGEDLSSSVDDSRNGILDKLKSDQHILIDPVSRKMIHLYGLDQEDLGSHSFQDEKGRSLSYLPGIEIFPIIS